MNDHAKLLLLLGTRIVNNAQGFPSDNKSVRSLSRALESVLRQSGGRGSKLLGIRAFLTIFRGTSVKMFC